MNKAGRNTSTTGYKYSSIINEDFTHTHTHAHLELKSSEDGHFCIRIEEKFEKHLAS